MELALNCCGWSVRVQFKRGIEAQRPALLTSNSKSNFYFSSLFLRSRSCPHRFTYRYQSWQYCVATMCSLRLPRLRAGGLTWELSLSFGERCDQTSECYTDRTGNDRGANSYIEFVSQESPCSTNGAASLQTMRRPKNGRKCRQIGHTTPSAKYCLPGSTT